MQVPVSQACVTPQWTNTIGNCIRISYFKFQTVVIIYLWKTTLLFNLLTIIVGKIRISISIVNKSFPPECFLVIEKGSLLRSGNNGLHLYTGLIRINYSIWSIQAEQHVVCRTTDRSIHSVKSASHRQPEHSKINLQHTKRKKIQPYLSLLKLINIAAINGTFNYP